MSMFLWATTPGSRSFITFARLRPRAMIYALANEKSLHIGAQAVALGGSGLIMMPPSGDELLNAAAETRARLAAVSERRNLEERAEFARRVAESAGRIAGLAECADRREAARKLAQIFAEMSGATAASVYIPACEGSTELVSIGNPRHDARTAPTFTDEMGLVHLCAAKRLRGDPALVRHLAEGHVLLSGMASEWGPVERSAGAHGGSGGDHARACSANASVPLAALSRI